MIIYCLLFHTNCLPCISIFIPLLFALLSSAPSVFFSTVLQISFANFIRNFNPMKLHFDSQWLWETKWRIRLVDLSVGKRTPSTSSQYWFYSKHVLDTCSTFASKEIYANTATILQLFENYFMSETANIKLVVSSSSPPAPPVSSVTNFKMLLRMRKNENKPRVKIFSELLWKLKWNQCIWPRFCLLFLSLCVCLPSECLLTFHFQCCTLTVY